MHVLVASHNSGKRVELERVLDAAALRGVDVVSLDDVSSYPEPRETGATFTENALIKAHAGVAATGLCTLADDSGLAVDALNGMPGIFSARWCGRHGDDSANNALLRAQLADVPKQRRGAAFVSVCVLVTPEGKEYVSEGVWRGSILGEPRGNNGFGYDPLFLPDEERAHAQRSSAQLSAEEKDALSHRRKALMGLIPVLSSLARSDD